MNKLTAAVFAGLITLVGVNVQAATPEQECKNCKMITILSTLLKVSVSKTLMQKLNMVMKTAIQQSQSSLIKNNNVLMKLKVVKKS